MAPSLRIHGSTQMTLTEPRGIEFVRELGVERVVLARELSIHDIQRITSETTMPLEVFIHGALCVAYSGQCLTSESLGGRSANRGQCAQACRLPYELVVDGETRDLGENAYLLSPQDLAAYELIEDLTQLGVASFKIEGRLKSAHYVAATTQTYRAAIQSALTHEKFRITQQQRADLEQTFSRGFSHGFLSGVNHQVLVNARFPKSRGSRIGTIAQITDRSVVVELENYVAQPPAAVLRHPHSRGRVCHKSACSCERSTNSIPCSRGRMRRGRRSSTATSKTFGDTRKPSRAVAPRICRSRSRRCAS
jgi:putative protease